MRKQDKPTHVVQYKRSGEGWSEQRAWGKKDLLQLLVHLLKDGYEQFTINPY